MEERNKMKKWKVALIGCGSIADNTYLPRIKDIPEADMVAVCDIIPERAKDYAENLMCRHGTPALTNCWKSAILRF